MWVKGDLKDRLGIGHRKRGARASHHSSASSLEAAPMIYEPHHDTSSEMALNELPMSKRESYQAPPAMSEANAQYIQAPAPAGDALLSPSRAYNSDRDRKNTVISPSPSYYSASEIPPSSPLPSPKYKYSTGEITSTPPPPSRRSSAASRATSRRSPPPGPMPTSPLPPQPQTSGTPTQSPLPTPTTPNYPQMPPPSSFLQTSNVSRTHLRDPSGASYGHGFERSGSSAASYVSHAESYATADEFFDAEPHTPKQQQAFGGQEQNSPHSNNPYYRRNNGGESDDAYGGIAVSQQSLPAGRQLQEPPKGPYPHHGHPRNEPTDQWEGPTAL